MKQSHCSLTELASADILDLFRSHLTKGGFTGSEFQDLLGTYGVKSKPSTSRNPRSNSVVERVHKCFHNMLRTFDLQVQAFDPTEPWQGYLSNVPSAIRSSYHTTIGATAADLVYCREIIFNRDHVPNWEQMRKNKQGLIIKNNLKENAKRIEHDYRVGDDVLYRSRGDKKQKHERPYDGPFKILKIFSNGTVRLQCGDKIKQ